MPLDWGLKPPIETLPQMAQVRAMSSRYSEVGEEGAHGIPRAAGYYSIDDRPQTDQQREWATSNAHQPLSRRPAVTPEEITELVRRTAADAYGVLSVGGQRWYDRLLALIGRGRRGVSVQMQPLRIELRLRVAPGLPKAAVADNVEEAVRYAVQRDLGRSIDELTVHVDAADAAR
jgi:uncharacterized alkaline shock family protein YloU